MTAEEGGGEALKRHGEAIRQGKAAQAAGRRVEEWIDWSCRRLAQEGHAWVRNTEPAVGFGGAGSARRRPGGRWGPGPRGGVFFRSAGPPDYIGFLAGGRGLCFDLKSTQKPSWQWEVRKGKDPRETFRHAKTKERQMQDLEEAARFGALAGLVVVLLSSGPSPVCMWVPARLIRRVAVGGWSASALEEAGAVAAVWPSGRDPEWLAAALAASNADAIAAAGAVKRAFEDG